MKLPACLYFQEDPTCLGDASLFRRSTWKGRDGVPFGYLVPFCKNCTKESDSMPIDDDLLNEYICQDIMRS